MIKIDLLYLPGIFYNPTNIAESSQEKPINPG